MKISTQFIGVLICILCGQSMIAQNLVDMSDWVSGTTGATTNYNIQGSTSQNARITMTGPYGNQVTVWEASADGASGMNGGFSHNGVILDTDKTYRISFWIQSTGPNNCSNFAGFVPYYVGGGLFQPWDNENGGSTNWPYLAQINYPNDQWFLVVGYVRPASASDLGDSGVYDPSTGTAPNLPTTSYGTTDFIFPSSESQVSIRIRTFMWNCASGEKMFTYDPRVEEISNAIPLSDVLYGTTGSDTQDPIAPSLSSTGQGETTADLSWSGATDNVGVTGYKVFKDGVLEDTLGNVSSYQVVGLTASTSYSFTVTALDAAGNESTVSNAVSVTTDASSGGGGSSEWTESGSTLSHTGEVAIGTSSVPSGYKLAVDGHIRTREIRVDQDTWPDYVFEEGYDLPSLAEIQKHIDEKGHLPNIPSAEEVVSNGMDVGEMNRLLLEKVEELTLYVLEHEKKIEALESTNKSIPKRNSEETKNSTAAFGLEKVLEQPLMASIIWEEDFTGLADGSTSDTGTTAWSATITQGTAEVQTGLFAFQGSNSVSNATWISDNIDISNYNNISISYLVGDAGDAEKETSDYVRGFYILDGGSRVQFANITDDVPTPVTQSTSGLNGSTLRIEIDFRVSYGNETYNIDDIVVEGDLIGGSDTQDPTAPTLSSTGQGETTADLSWSGATDNVGVTGYNVYKDGVLETNTSASPYAVTGLTASTSYSFTVTALDAAGNESTASNAVSVTTDASSGGGGSSAWSPSGSTLSHTGEVAIGTSSVPSGYKLAVDGHIRTREIRVDQDTWPDYVFEEDYQLPSLIEIQEYIEEKGHLPNIPSAAEATANGVELGEMNKLLLEKIEELTLYLLHQEERIELLENKKIAKK